jgi:hypothetical protein
MRLHPVAHAVKQFAAERVGSFDQQGDHGPGCGFATGRHGAMKIDGFLKNTNKIWNSTWIPQWTFAIPTILR